ncbi:hypothetical protein ACM39_12665 [Chryseobacterium sp. FH2]|uniref:class I lanthipeptide n=1 Tax=Chryseobacterium sp. FH2 TaxID=1674291 RepID=UPI00065A9F76|nr:class I lanthipeptide [Chryseobacterium sp. FH2]KMQ67700.1 hypothetical protein ACM39_12665 [Chryseobacterium sp. FH2]
MKKKKLSLNKQKITKLSAEQSGSIQGGLAAAGTGASTNNGFTCCWCTGGNSNSDKCLDPEPVSIASNCTLTQR